MQYFVPRLRIASLRLQSLYRLAGWATALGCLVLGTMSFLASLDDYLSYRRGAEELARFQLSLLAANTVSAERGPANSLMGASASDAPKFAAQLADKRRKTDRSLDDLEASFARERTRFAENRDQIGAARKQLGKGRAAVDTVSATPSEAQKGADIAAAITQMFLAADAITVLRNDVGSKIVATSPQISSEILLSTICGNLREHAGRFGSYVVMALTSSTPVGDEIRGKLASTQGRLDELRALAGTYAAPFLQDPRVTATLGDLDREYFAGALPFAQDIAARSETTPGLMSSAEFTARYVPGMAAVEKLRELIVALTVQRVADARDHAERLVLVAGGLTLFVAAVLIFINAALHRFLFLPLMSARKQIVSIAHGNLAEPPAGRQVGEEIREMFSGLQTLREHQRQHAAIAREREHIARDLKRLSETDSLTGLLNRRALDAIGPKTLAEADAVSEIVVFMLLDIDHFKAINDTHGHAVGDVVLQQVAATLQPLLQPDDRLARFGGEEFAFLRSGGTVEEALAIAEAFRLALAAMSIGDNLNLKVTASFGLAVRRSIDNWIELVSGADRELYRAKRSGRNRICATGPGLKKSASVAMG